MDVIPSEYLDPPDGHATADPVLRAKYVDYCSAQLTDVFLSLSDERIYELVEEAAEETRLQAGALGYRTMVRLVTRRLRQCVPLPDFEAWCRDYRADPGRFDVHLLGLWEELLAGEATGGGCPAG